jgi:gluconate 2-dehydrogenase alpha chain
MTALNERNRRTVEAIFERLFPADDRGPGATEIGAAVYLDRALDGAYREHRETYRLGLDALDSASSSQFGKPFAASTAEQQDHLLKQLEDGSLPGVRIPAQREFFELLRAHCIEGLFSDPIYGGNRDKLGWKTLGHPGVWLENSAEENLATTPVTKGGRIQSLEDIGFDQAWSARSDQSLDGYDPQQSLEPPAGKADVVLVGVGAIGGFVAPMLAGAGLKVVGLESGPFWKLSDFVPDELGTAYYCRAEMGQKFGSETPTWRTSTDAETGEATFSLGRMMNGVGGSVIHYGAWLRRFHPHHFKFRSFLVDAYGVSAIPEGCTVADWPVSYEELEPHFTRVEQIVGVAGDETNPFVTRSKPLPLPPMRPFRLGELFRGVTSEMGLHPHPIPVGQNTAPYNGFPATTYSAWNNGFGSWDGDKWQPGLNSVQEALGTGNFTLRTHCRVVRIITDSDGRATGVEYLDPLGRLHLQQAKVVVLSAYTYENIRLMMLSGRLGDRHGQLGKHYMTKQFAHVDGFFPDVVFNRHTGPAAQAIVLDDFLAQTFDSMAAGGFVGGATLGAENQFLPIQVAKESLPRDVPRWGERYKAHLLDWQHLGVVRIQPDALPYEHHCIDLDPLRRDKSGLGMPVVRLTYDLMSNERRLAAYFEGLSSEILRSMGAERTWAGPRFTGVGSSHDLGGARMSVDPATGVVDRNLQVHDTPGLYVFSGAAFPTCPGINPTLTLWALSSLAAERLIERFADGEEG